MALVEVGDLINYLNDPMALVGVGDLISSVEMLVGVGDLINCTRFAYICGFGNSWRLEDTRSTSGPSTSNSAHHWLP